MIQLKSGIFSFLLAVAATSAALLASHFVLVPLFDQNAFLLTFVLAVVGATWWGGVRSGLWVSLLGSLASALLAGDATGEPVAALALLARPLLLFALGVLVSWLVGLVQAGRLRQQEQLAAEVRGRAAAELALREREQRIRLAVEAADIGTWDFNILTGQQEWSPRARAMFGLAADADLSKVSFRDRVHREDKDRVVGAIERAFDPRGDGSYEVDCRLVWPDNSIHWFIAKGQAMFEGEGAQRRATRLIGAVVDITARKLAEQTVRQAEERYRKLATLAPVGIFHTDGQGACLFVNDSWCVITGVTLEDALGDGWQKCLHPEDRQRVLDEWKQAAPQGRSYASEFRFLNPASGPRWVLVTATAMFDAAGTVSGYVGTVVDLTERKAIEDVVRASELRLRGILDNTPAVISLKDKQGRYILVNRPWEELFEVTNEQIAGLTNYELLSMTRSCHMSRQLADEFLKIDREVLETGAPVEFEDPMPYGDDQKVFMTVKFPIKEAGGETIGVGGISLDITERRNAIQSLKTEREFLRHTIEAQDHQRQLIAYEIHDGLVQYVAGALMQLDSLRATEALPEATLQRIDPIVTAMRRAVAEGRRLINGIRTPVLDDWGVVAALEQLCEEEERAHVQVRFTKDSHLGRMAPRIEETIYRITQEALTNIYKHSQSKEVQISLVERGGRINLQIRDWGVGFVPVIDSQEVHGLRGMILRARMAGGKCTIDSSPGKGTHVIVDLPYISKELSTA